MPLGMKPKLRLRLSPAPRELEHKHKHEHEHEHECRAADRGPSRVSASALALTPALVPVVQPEMLAHCPKPSHLARHGL